MTINYPPAAVLSGNLGPTPKSRSLNEAALALTRSLGRRHVRVFRFHPDHSLADIDSRYCTHVRCANLYDRPEELADQLIAFSSAQAGRPVLFPASDGAADFIADYRAQLAPHFAIPSPCRDSLEKIQQKRVLLEFARQLGVPVPETYFPETLAELRSVAAKIRYPAVFKPLVSQHWKRREVVAAIGPVKAMVVEDAETAERFYQKIFRLAPQMMLQEVIPGDDQQLLTFLGYVGKQGRALAGCVRKKLGQMPPGFGYCSMTETVHDAEVMQLAIRLLEALDYHGIAGVEFKRDPRDGLPKLIEINARAVRTTAAAIAAGVDLPWLAYQDVATAGDVTPVFDYAVPTRWIHARSALRSLWEHGHWLRAACGIPGALLRGRVVLAEWAWDDPRPGLASILAPARRRIPRPWFFAARPVQQVTLGEIDR